MTRRVLPDPRLPRSPRVRDRWDRMRPPVALRRRWDMEPWIVAGNPEDAAMAATAPWKRAVVARYGPGTMDMQIQDWPRVLITTYHPHRKA